jgi:hypothetical protein
MQSGAEISDWGDGSGLTPLNVRLVCILSGVPHSERLAAAPWHDGSERPTRRFHG